MVRWYDRNGSHCSILLAEREELERRGEVDN
jgi:hypothetical protein